MMEAPSEEGPHEESSFGPLRWSEQACNIEWTQSSSGSVVGGRLYIYGGYSLLECRNVNTLRVIDCGTNDFMGWRVDVEGDEVGNAKNGQVSVLVDDRLFIFGGWTGQTMDSALSVFDIPMSSWMFPSTYGHAHPSQNLTAAGFIEKLGKIVLFGGSSSVTCTNAVTCLNPLSFQWSELKTKGEPPQARAHHSSCVSGLLFFIFGGWDRVEGFSNIHVLTMAIQGRAVWSVLDTERPAMSRTGAALAVVQGRLMVFGGLNPNADDDEHVEPVIIFDIKRREWVYVEHTQEKPRHLKQEKGVVQTYGQRTDNDFLDSLSAVRGEEVLMFGATIPRLCILQLDHQQA